MPQKEKKVQLTFNTILLSLTQGMSKKNMREKHQMKGTERQKIIYS